jgi:hypothetical protein
VYLIAPDGRIQPLAPRSSRRDTDSGGASRVGRLADPILAVHARDLEASLVRRAADRAIISSVLDSASAYGRPGSGRRVRISDGMIISRWAALKIVPDALDLLSGLLGLCWTAGHVSHD